MHVLMCMIIQEVAGMCVCRAGFKKLYQSMVCFTHTHCMKSAWLPFKHWYIRILLRLSTCTFTLSLWAVAIVYLSVPTLLLVAGRFSQCKLPLTSLWSHVTFNGIPTNRGIFVIPNTRTEVLILPNCIVYHTSYHSAWQFSENQRRGSTLEPLNN